MEAIARAIFNGLVRRGQVILPEVGALYTERIAATTDESGRISVPKKVIRFTRVEEEGITLPEILSRQSDIPLKDVKSQYNRWLSNLKRNTSSGNFTIEGVVSLTQQPDGSFSVVPFHELERLLNPIESEHIQLPVLPQAREGVKPAASQRASSAKKNPAPVQREKAGKKSGKAWIVALPVILLLGGAGYYIYTQGWLAPSQQSLPAPEPVRLPVEIPVALPDAIPADSVAQDPEIVSPEIPIATGNGVLPAAHTGDVYHVIAGVFSTQANAERYVRENNFGPDRTTIIPTSNGRFMVSMGKYATKEEADAEMKRLSRQIPEAWVSQRRK